MTPELKTRLDSITERLKARGIQDIKFTFAPDAPFKDPNVLGAQVADFVEAYLDGKTVTIDNIDAHLQDSTVSVEPRMSAEEEVLCMYHGVTSRRDLIQAQARQIRRLQDQLNALTRNVTIDGTTHVVFM